MKKLISTAQGIYNTIPYERIATAVIAACMIGFIVLLVWAAI